MSVNVSTDEVVAKMTDFASAIQHGSEVGWAEGYMGEPPEFFVGSLAYQLADWGIGQMRQASAAREDPGPDLSTSGVHDAILITLLAQLKGTADAILEIY